MMWRTELGAKLSCQEICRHKKVPTWHGARIWRWQVKSRPKQDQSYWELVNTNKPASTIAFPQYDKLSLPISSTSEWLKLVTSPGVNNRIGIWQHLLFLVRSRQLSQRQQQRTTSTHSNRELQSDTSGAGFGATLMQETQPVAFSSRTSSKSEQHCCQLKEELLVIVFGMYHFDRYVHLTAFVVSVWT